MNANCLVVIGGLWLDVLITWQTLLSAKVSVVSMFLRLILFAAEAILVMAWAATHTKTTN